MRTAPLGTTPVPECEVKTHDDWVHAGETRSASRRLSPTKAAVPQQHLSPCRDRRPHNRPNHLVACRGPRGRSLGQNSAWNIIWIIFHAMPGHREAGPDPPRDLPSQAPVGSLTGCPGACFGGPVLPGGIVTSPLSGHARLWIGSVIGLGVALVASHQGAAPVRPKFRGAGRAWPKTSGSRFYTAHAPCPSRWRRPLAPDQTSIARPAGFHAQGHHACGQDLTFR